jgi:hypothetical protein
LPFSLFFFHTKRRRGGEAIPSPYQIIIIASSIIASPLVDDRYFDDGVATSTTKTEFLCVYFVRNIMEEEGHDLNKIVNIIIQLLGKP